MCQAWQEKRNKATTWKRTAAKFKRVTVFTFLRAQALNLSIALFRREINQKNNKSKLKTDDRSENRLCVIPADTCILPPARRADSSITASELVTGLKGKAKHVETFYGCFRDLSV